MDKPLPQASETKPPGSLDASKDEHDVGGVSRPGGGSSLIEDEVPDEVHIVKEKDDPGNKEKSQSH